MCLGGWAPRPAVEMDKGSEYTMAVTNMLSTTTAVLVLLLIFEGFVCPVHIIAVYFT